MTESVAIVSGGMDSVTLLYDMCSKGYRPHVLSFNYGQRHQKELDYAQYHTEKFSLSHDIIDLNFTHLISNSALTSSVKYPVPRNEKGSMQIGYETEVPEGHYAEESMKATVVPNRNMMMLSIAGAVAVNNKAVILGIGVHGGDHFIYPDCRNEFIRLFETTLRSGNEGFLAPGFHVYSPFLGRGKEHIAKLGAELNVDFAMTWSCYKGGEKHCGKCGTCVERKEAFQLANVYDPTVYESE